MNTPYVRAPHQEGAGKNATHTHTAPNAALLIDFDNVTMGMRSDLSDELKTLLNSDIIKGKVAVQRAYADWRRYPQYIVPLSEASIDLIFAPAYGSNKKNATDIRMAIDALELIFIRPEIGTFILLTGDSDFSSLVLKLKEYGKYVIGVGIQESSSDILVQNCDEYYSYTSLAGLRKTTDADTEPVDPWLLVERALERMQSRNDVMRSDRLKQVMMEIDAGFDESEYGFSKFSKFLTEASSRGLVDLRKMSDGQYEVRASAGGGARGDGDGAESPSGAAGKGRGGRAATGRRGRGRKTRPRGRTQEARPEPPEAPAAAGGGEPLQDAYELLTDAVRTLTRERDVPAVRDSDVKRKMLDRDRSFDEAELGFGKFSLFLQQADEHDVIDLVQRDDGNYEVSLPGAGPPVKESEEPGAGETPASEQRVAEPPAAEPEAPAKEPAEERSAGPAPSRTGRGLGMRGGERSRRKKPGEGEGAGPPILEGQVVGRGRGTSEDRDGGGPSGGGDRGERSPSGAASGSEVLAPDALGLPTDRAAVIRYLANSYRGVGEKTAEALVDELGTDLFEVLQTDPDRVRDVVPANRAEQLLDAWEDDFTRRRGRVEQKGGTAPTGDPPGGGSQPGPDPSGTESAAGDASAGVRPTGEPGPASASPDEEPRGDAAEEPEDGGEEAQGEEEPPPSRLGPRRGRRTRR